MGNHHSVASSLLLWVDMLDVVNGGNHSIKCFGFFCFVGLVLVCFAENKPDVEVAERSLLC